MIEGRVFAESQAPLNINGQKLPVKAPLSSSTLSWALWFGVCTGLTLCCAQRDFSRDFIVLLQSSFDHCQRASGSFANLREVHHGIDVVRYPLLLVRSALEMEAGLLD